MPVHGRDAVFVLRPEITPIPSGGHKASGKDVSDEDFKAAARILEGVAIDTGLAKMWQSQGLDYGKRLPPPVMLPPGRR
jgi:hypothetical protein